MNASVEVARVPPVVDKGGAWVRMGEKEYKVAPLNFKSLRELAPSIVALQNLSLGASGLPSIEQMDTLTRLAHAALKRNYPAMAEDEVADNLDFGNFSDVLGAVLGVAGLNDKGVAAPGETQPTP